MWDLWRGNWHWGRFSPSTSVSPANLHPTDCSTIIIIWGWYNRPNSGRCTKWTPHPMRKKKSTDFRVVMMCSSEGARHFEGKYRLHLQANFRLLLLVSCSDYSSTVMMGVIGSSKTTTTLRSKQHHSPDDRALHTHRRENLRYSTA
jgi:hypothetical protein